MLGNVVKVKDVKLAIGKLVKMLRKNERISQQDLADKLSLSRITIQNLEAGKNFTIDTLLVVVSHFDKLTDLHELLESQISENENVVSLY